MENKQLKITPPEGYVVDEEASTFENIVFKKKKTKYPTEQRDVLILNPHYIADRGEIRELTFSNIPTPLSYNGEGNTNLISGRERTLAVLVLLKLIAIRDHWNREDNFQPDWTDVKQNKFCISTVGGKIETDIYQTFNYILCFGKAETRNLFLETFKKDIELVKEFL